MRKVGIGALGVVGGVLLALIVQDLLATAFIRDGTGSIGLGMVFGFLMPVFAVLGGVIAVLLYSRGTKGKARKTTDE